MTPPGWDAVHHFVPSLYPNDGVGGHVVRAATAQRTAGRHSEIFVESVHPDTSHLCHHVSTLDEHVDPQQRTLFVYHAATGSALPTLLLGRHEPLVVQHHNLTPFELVAPWSPEVVPDIALGRRQLVELAGRAVLGIGDSAHNARELARLGFRRTAVAPIMLRPELVATNARHSFDARFRVLKPSSKAIQEAVREALGLAEAPRRIECFDISHIQGSDPVASMVVWDEGRMKKADYRKYIIRSAAGGDDFASMREVVARRYSRLLAEGKPMPGLVLIDGGLGQLHAAAEALGVAPVSLGARRVEGQAYVHRKGNVGLHAGDAGVRAAQANLLLHGGDAINEIGRASCRERV